jgi:3-deoxy-D-manno-octulosonic-acid transferase
VYVGYSALLLLLLLLSVPWWLWQMLRHGKYRAGWSERLGSVPRRLRTGKIETIWIHAVSVGEVLAITRVVDELRTQLPHWRLVVSTTTDTGQKLARQKFGHENVFYLPLDLPWAVQAYVDALQPRLLVLAESEFWPNLLHCTCQSGAAIAVVNARVSDRSLPRYLRFRRFFERVLDDVSVFLAQSPEDATRLVAIGAPSALVHVGGNLKFDVAPPRRVEIVDRIAEEIRRENLGPVIVAGSTLDGEETMLLKAFRAVCEQQPSAMLLLAPRHPERFAGVAALLASSGIQFQRRSQWSGEPLVPGSVLLLDTIGELASSYQFADLALVGGSLVPKGGHNILEPAYLGVPILVGSHTENFRDIVEIFRRADAVTVVTLQTLTTTILNLLSKPEERARLGRNAKEVLREQQGATRRAVDAILGLLRDPGVPVPVETAAERQA